MESRDKKGNLGIFFITLIIILTYFQFSMEAEGGKKVGEIIANERITQNEDICTNDISSNTFAEEKLKTEDVINNIKERDSSFKTDLNVNCISYNIKESNPSFIQEPKEKSFVPNFDKITETAKKIAVPNPIMSTELTYYNDEGDDYLPTLIKFKGKLFAIWYTNDPLISDGNDIDIVYRTFDGHIWSDIKEISNNNENDSFQWRCGERSGKAIIYRDKLYFIWHVYSEGKLYPYKIIIKSYDGANWNEIKEISLSEKYWFYRAPAAEVYKDKLYITWDAGDIEPFDHTDLLMCYFNGKRWSEPIDIIPSYDSSQSPIHMKVFKGRLYLAWLHVGNHPYHKCVKMKYWDGINWSDEIIVNPDGDAYVLSDVEIYKDKLYITWVTFTEDIYQWFKIRGFDGNNFGEIHIIDYKEDIKLVTYKSKLFSIGTTSSPTYTSGRDRDIVMESYDGSSWGNMSEISYKQDESSSEGYDNDPFAIVFNSNLYIIWQTKSSITSTGDDNDIIIKEVPFN